MAENYTRHAKQRIKERITTKNADRLLQLALERGITAETATSETMKKYLTRRTDDEVFATIYNGFCFIVDRSTNLCITTYSLPADLKHEKRIYCNGRKISSTRTKNYYKKNSEFLGDADDERYIKEIYKQYIG